MSRAPGSPIVYDDWDGDLDSLFATIATQAGQIADLNTRVFLDANIGYKGHTAGDTNQLIANSGSLFASISVSFNTVADRVIKSTFTCRAQSATAGDVVTFILMDDDVMVGIGAADATMAANDGLDSVSFIAITAPSAGFHTYKLYITMTNGVGPGGYIGSGNAPAWLLIEDIGEVA